GAGVWVVLWGFGRAGVLRGCEPCAYGTRLRHTAVLWLRGWEGYRRPDLPARRPEGCWDAYVRMSGVRELYARVKGESFIQMPLKKQSYGDWEFEARDPNGYVLVFGGDVDVD